jgi:dTMP kinase
MYLVIEGIDGSGKSTLAEEINIELNRSGFKSVSVKEPFDSHIEKVIENIKVMEYRNEDEILARLFSADRLMLKDTIEDYLEQDFIVISDRSMYSSFVYQNSGDNHEINKRMIPPEFVIYLDIEPELAAQRFAGDNKFENVNFLEGVRWAYSIYQQSSNWYTIDASQDFEKVFKQAMDIIKLKMREKFLEGEQNE